MGQDFSQSIDSATPEWLKNDLHKVQRHIKREISFVSREASMVKQVACLTYPSLRGSIGDLNSVLKTCCAGNNEKVMFGLQSIELEPSAFWKVHVRIICLKINTTERTVRVPRVLNLHQYWKLRSSIMREIMLSESFSDNFNASLDADYEFINHEDIPGGGSNDCQDISEQSFVSSLAASPHLMSASTVLQRVDAVPRSRNEDECMICMDNKIEVTLKCAHSFCSNCIEQWSKDMHTCPQCRDLIYTTDEFWEMSDIPTLDQLRKHLIVLATGS